MLINGISSVSSAAVDRRGIWRRLTRKIRGSVFDQSTDAVDEGRRFLSDKQGGTQWRWSNSGTGGITLRGRKISGIDGR